MEKQKETVRNREPSPEIDELLALIRTLRSPEGCPWDRVQKETDLRRYLLSEAYEVIDAIAEGSPADLREELGDLLFQILFLVVLAEEQGHFNFAGVVRGISEKMIRRHPHVFADTSVRDVSEVKANWEKIKATQEHKDKHVSPLNVGISRSLPALSRAQAITAQAATVGFDWERTDQVIEKIEEELQELKEAIRMKDHDNMEEEIGDLLFSVVNLSRFANVQAEEALRRTTGKFLRRFQYIEKRLQEKGVSLEEATLEVMDRLWEEAKGRIFN
ncbi:MAG: nucleoside triphosphate pyrophosphohydrolase [Syntrophus sp. (in: bacteria)]